MTKIIATHHSRSDYTEIEILGEKPIIIDYPSHDGLLFFDALTKMFATTFVVDMAYISIEIDLDKRSL